MLNRDEVLKHALSLPVADQAFVADMLEREIAATQAIPRELGKEWTTEIDRRVAAYECSEMMSLDIEQSLQLLRQAILAHQRSKSQGLSSETA
jgi:hypothetical protein